MTTRLLTLCASLVLIAGCDSAEVPETQPPPPGPAVPPETPPSTPPPARFAFTSGLRYVGPTAADEVVPAPGCSFVGDEAMNPPRYRLEEGDLAIDGEAFALTLAGRAFPYESSPTVTRVVRGTVARSGSVLRLTSGSRTLVATVGPTVDAPTTVHLQSDSFLQGNAGPCSLYRFTTDGTVAGVAGVGTDTANYVAISNDGRTFPYYQGSFSTTAVYHHFLDFQLRPDGTYTAALAYHYNSEPVRWEAVTGRYVGGLGDPLVLNPGRATQVVSSAANYVRTLPDGGLHFPSNTYWTGGTLVLSRGVSRATTSKAFPSAPAGPAALARSSRN